MNKNPKVSVIIPTFNRAGYLKESIESVLRQSFSDYELIVVDDGSTDATKEVCAKYQDKIQYFYQKNQGNPNARNQGIRLARGKYIAPLDDDDFWMPDKLSVQVEAMEKNSELAFVCSNAYAVDEKGNILKKFFQNFSAHACTFERLIFDNFILHLTVLIKKDTLLEYGGYDVSLQSCQDYDLLLRIAKKYPFASLNVPLACYRVHASNLSNDLEQALENHIRMLKKREIVGGLAFFKVNHIRARHYFRFAGYFIKSNQLKRARFCLLQALIHSPVIGRHFWPDDLRGERRTLLKRVVRPYVQLFKNYHKNFKNNIKI